MKCPKCGSEDVKVQIVTEMQLKNQHHSIWWWLLWGWIWIPIKWLCFALIALIVKIFSHKKQKVKTTHKNMAICQACGNSWEIKKTSN